MAGLKRTRVEFALAALVVAVVFPHPKFADLNTTADGIVNSTQVVVLAMRLMLGAVSSMRFMAAFCSLNMLLRESKDRNRCGERGAASIVTTMQAVELITAPIELMYSLHI
jgi:hypothetical protein